MRTILKTAVAASALMGAAALMSTPAEAHSGFSISIGIPNAITFDLNSGGYCDSYGCPDSYWNYPVWYGPVYYRGRWYKGPVYYREDDGRRVYWIRGGWHHDQWRGSRPSWWSRGNYYTGPALGYSYYKGHGFRHDRDRHWRGNDWNGGRHDNSNWNDRNGHDRNQNWRNNDNNHGWNKGHDRDDRRGDNNGWNRHGSQHNGIVTTTANPAAVYQSQTGKPASGSSSNNGSNGNSDHHRHRHDNSNGDNNGH